MVALDSQVAVVAATSMRRVRRWHKQHQRSGAMWALRGLQSSVLTLTFVSAAAFLVGHAAPAAADGELTLRGVYYKERATRVEEPILDATSDVGDHGEITGNLAIDVITSASVAAGADAKAFTEKRYEAGGGYAHTIGRYRISGNGRYSTESDYVARYLGVGVSIDLAEKNTQLGFGAGQSRDDISNAGAQSPFAVVPSRDDFDHGIYVGNAVGRAQHGYRRKCRFLVDFRLSSQSVSISHYQPRLDLRTPSK